MLERDARRDPTFGHLLGQVDDSDGWFGASSVAEIAPAVAPGTDVARRDAPEHRGRHARGDDSTALVAVPGSSSGPRHAAPDVPSHAAPEVPDLAAVMHFRARRPAPWYRRRAVLPVLSALAVTAVLGPVLLVMLREPTPAPEPVRPVPAPVTTAATSAPLAPPPPPPLPIPLPAQESQPPVDHQPPADPDRHTEPTRQRKPEIGVTRTPVTRKPISAVPPPPPTTGRNSGTPGDEPRHWGLW